MGDAFCPLSFLNDESDLKSHGEVEVAVEARGQTQHNWTRVLPSYHHNTIGQ